MSSHFMSYSSADGKEFSLRLADELSAGPPPMLVWIDVRELRPGQAWDEQLAEAIKQAKTLLFVMTQDSVEPWSECKSEWTRALRYNKPVIPILLDAEVEVPFRLGNRQYIDFTGNFNTGLARLRQHLQWLDSPEGRTQCLKERLADAERDLRRVTREPQRVRVEKRMEQIHREIETLRQDREGTKPQVEVPQPVPEDTTKSTDDIIISNIADNQDVYAFDTDDPPPDVWYRQLRPVLHQASHYSVPTYYLDQNLKVIDWNVAFGLIFSDLIAAIRYKHVNWFIVRMANCDQMFDHARRFTDRVRRGALPLVDLEPIRYVSEVYGDVLFEKVAAPLHDRKGQIRGWTVALLIREIEWSEFLRDLKDKLWQDKLWSLYAESYDPVLREFAPYHALIDDIVSVVSSGEKHVADLGAGSGNVTAALVKNGHRVTAVELNLSMLDWLRSRKFDPKKVSIVKGTIEQLDMLGDATFDAAVMCNVLYAVDDPYGVLKEVHAILKPGGVLSYSTTHADCRLGKLLDSIRSTLEKNGKFEQLNHHFVNLREANETIENTIARRFSRDEYIEWTGAAGFELLRDPWDTYEDSVMVVHARKR